MSELDNQTQGDIVESDKPDAVVVLEDQKPKTDDTVKSGEIIEEPKAKPRNAAEEGVEALARNLEKAKKEAETERSARISAENRATEAETKASTATVRVSEQEQQNINANRTAATNAKAAAQSDLDKFKKQAAELQAEGKFEEAEDARMAAFEAKNAVKHADGYLAQLDTYMANKATTDGLRDRSATAQEKPQSDASGTVDPVTGIKFTPKTFDYIKAQGDNWKDQDFRVACDAANKAATRKGIKPDTDEWAEFMDNKLIALGFKDEPQQGDEVEEEPEIKAKPVVAKKPTGASTGAAPTRAVQGSSGVAKKSVKLSGAERDIAQSIVDSLPDYFKDENPDQLYAKHKQAGLDEHGEDWLRTPTN